MKKIILTILLTFGITLSHAEVANGQTTENFVLTNTEGEKIHITPTTEGLDFKEFHGKAIFLVLFGHMCPPCNAEIPEFIELTEKYKDKLAIVAIEAQRYDLEKLKEFKAHKGINYNLVSGKDSDDFIGHIAQRAGWSGAIPFLIALDKNGEVQTVQQGFIAKEILEGLIDKLTK